MCMQALGSTGAGLAAAALSPQENIGVIVAYCSVWVSARPIEHKTCRIGGGEYGHGLEHAMLYLSN